MVYDSERKELKLSPHKRFPGPSPGGALAQSSQLSPPSGGVASVTAPNSDRNRSVHMGRCPPGTLPEPGFSVGLRHAHIRGGCLRGWAVPSHSGAWRAPCAPGGICDLQHIPKVVVEGPGTVVPTRSRCCLSGQSAGQKRSPSARVLLLLRRLPRRSASLRLCLVFLPCARVCAALARWV